MVPNVEIGEIKLAEKHVILRESAVQLLSLKKPLNKQPNYLESENESGGMKLTNINVQVKRQCKDPYCHSDS